MTIDRIRADLAAAETAGEHHRAKVLRFVLTLIEERAARNQDGIASEADVQSAIREALSDAEAQEGRMERSNRVAAAELSERDVLLLAGYVNG